MVVYPDTSFLFSLYARDTNSHQAYTWMRSLRSPMIFSPHQRHELRNALRLSVFRGDSTDAQCQKVLVNIEQDVANGILLLTSPDWAETYARAEMMSKSFSYETGCRAADILHVAIAVQLEAQKFLTFDTHQHTLASKVSLTTPV